MAGTFAAAYPALVHRLSAASPPPTELGACCKQGNNVFLGDNRSDRAATGCVDVDREAFANGSNGRTVGGHCQRLSFSRSVQSWGSLIGDRSCTIDGGRRRRQEKFGPITPCRSIVSIMSGPSKSGLRVRRAAAAAAAAASSNNKMGPTSAEDIPTVNGTVVVSGSKGDGGVRGSMKQASTALMEKSVTGGALDYKGATAPLVLKPLPVTKTIVLVRHGLSAWNEESRVQGSSDMSVLSDKGKVQAVRCREALSHINFDACFSSPISRAKTSAEIIWEGREGPLVYLDSLKEANLLFLEGMRNADALEQYPELYNAWRQKPEEFNVDGVYPVVNLWARARKAWEELLSSEAETILVVTHKSIMRSLLCTALGLGPDKFRCVDVNNGGVSIFCVNRRGEPMLQNSNLTTHLYLDNVHYKI